MLFLLFAYSISWGALLLLPCHDTITRIFSSFPTMSTFHATLLPFFL